MKKAFSIFRPARATSWRRRRCRAAVVCVLSLALVGCSAQPQATVRTEPGLGGSEPTLDGLDAALWIERSEEARILRQTVYAAAGRALETALADPSWSALDQGEAAAGLPPAAILDLDETVLDNAPYNAGLTLRGERFAPGSWSAWVEAAEAEAVPGALEFAQAAGKVGVKLFFVSNRDAPMEEATRRNLAALGLPLDAAEDTVLLRGERPEWRSDKSGRYLEIAARHRVLVLIGDDLNDFVSGARGGTLAERRAMGEANAARFGRDWFLLPNPIHGSWLRAVVDGSASAADETARKRAALRVFPAPGDGPP